MVLFFTFCLSLPNNIFHFLILFPVIILVCSSNKQMNVIVIDTIYATETGCTLWRHGNVLARRTNYHARQQSLWFYTKLSPLSLSHISNCIVFGKQADALTHLWMGHSPRLAFTRGYSAKATSKHTGNWQQPALLSTDLSLLPGSSGCPQPILLILQMMM